MSYKKVKKNKSGFNWKMALLLIIYCSQRVRELHTSAFSGNRVKYTEYTFSA